MQNENARSQPTGNRHLPKDCNIHTNKHSVPGLGSARGPLWVIWQTCNSNSDPPCMWTEAATRAEGPNRMQISPSAEVTWLLGQREGGSGHKVRVGMRRQDGPRAPRDREQPRTCLGEVGGKGAVAGSTTCEPRLQVPSKCSVVPTDFTYKTQLRR